MMYRLLLFIPAYIHTPVYDLTVINYIRKVLKKLKFLYIFFHRICKMKTLGLIGGTTWVSTIDYYRIINQQINEKLG